MTKAEELKLLEQIHVLIKSAGADSYIGETFAGVVGICRNNIEDDFANHPVHDLEMMRTRCDSEIRMHDKTKQMLDEAQKMCKEALDEVDELRKRNGELTRDAIGMAASLSTKDAEIKRLEQNNNALRADAEGMAKRIEELTDERDAMSDSLEGLNEILTNSEEQAANAIRMNNKYEGIVAEKDMEILRLKAEIYDLWKECGK